ncbi:unnamed protein product [Anisakis simplex]|uniref:Transmembrane protein 115 (inferred by orthology to a human protein) n=1 Tax=Anisakis simplex TaxID=6269 RepID=A0A0M3K6S5_ANISI|nr:unnamed protein product [Anisakis simplex]
MSVSISSQFDALIDNFKKSPPFYHFSVALLSIGAFVSVFESIFNVFSLSASQMMVSFELWRLITSVLVERNLILLIWSICCIHITSSLILPVWGHFELLKYFTIVQISSSIVITLIAFLSYVVHKNYTLFYHVQLYGCASMCAASYVAIKQFLPDTILLSSRVGRLKNNHLPILSLSIITILSLIGLVRWSASLQVALGIQLGWVYLRFYQPHSDMDLDGAQKDDASYGDYSDHFAWATLFPSKLQPMMSVISGVVFSTLIRLKICKPLVRHIDITKLDSVSVILPSLQAKDTERRRQKALRDLTERLSRTKRVSDADNTVSWSDNDDETSSDVISPPATAQIDSSQTAPLRGKEKHEPLSSAQPSSSHQVFACQIDFYSSLRKASLGLDVTIQDCSFQQKIWQRSGLLPYHQGLIFSGELLSDDEALISLYGITSNSTIRLVILTRSGPLSVQEQNDSGYNKLVSINRCNDEMMSSEAKQCKEEKVGRVFDEKFLDENRRTLFKMCELRRQMRRFKNEKEVVPRTSEPSSRVCVSAPEDTSAKESSIGDDDSDEYDYDDDESNDSLDHHNANQMSSAQGTSHNQLLSSNIYFNNSSSNQPSTSNSKIVLNKKSRQIASKGYAFAESITLRATTRQHRVPFRRQIELENSDITTSSDDERQRQKPSSIRRKSSETSCNLNANMMPSSSILLSSNPSALRRSWWLSRSVNNSTGNTTSQQQRCNACAVKLNTTLSSIAFQCRCGKTLCARHRAPDMHTCTRLRKLQDVSD